MRFFLRFLVLILICLGGTIAYHKVPAYQAAQADYAKAEGRIAEIIDAGTNNIDLSDLSMLRNLPPEIAQIKNLTYLDIATTQVSNLAPLAEIHTLKNLTVRGTRVSDLQPLVGLKGLTTLNIGGTWVSDIELISQIPNLQRLDIGITSLRSLEPVRRIPNLVWLNLHKSYAHDGSRVHFDALHESVPEVFNGSAYRQNYTPDGIYLMKLKIDRWARRLDMTPPFGVR